MSSSSAEPSSTKRGRLIVISGPSGAGKTSICRALLTRVPDTIWSVSATTRPARPSDEAGTSYEFLSSEEFDRRERRAEFLESAEYVGHRNGTPRAPVERALVEGANVVMEIDVQGGMQVAAKMPESLRVFVLPPNRDSLKARLEGRDGDVQEQLTQRLAESDGEIAVARDSGCYQYFVVNDVLEDTIAQVIGILTQESSSV